MRGGGVWRVSCDSLWCVNYGGSIQLCCYTHVQKTGLLVSLSGNNRIVVQSQV